MTPQHSSYSHTSWNYRTAIYGYALISHCMLWHCISSASLEFEKGSQHKCSCIFWLEFEEGVNECNLLGTFWRIKFTWFSAHHSKCCAMSSLPINLLFHRLQQLLERGLKRLQKTFCRLFNLNLEQVNFYRCCNVDEQGS